MLSRLDQYERALLGEVVENPRDELTLSVYADWLLDQPDRATQTRGEYIKLELAQGKTADPVERKDLHWQAYDLWWNHGENWLGPLYDAVDHFLYERGRLCIEISEETFMDRPAEEIEDAPAWELVTDIVFRSCGLELLRFLRRLPRPPMLTELDIPAGAIDGGEVGELLASGLWDDLESLRLDGLWMGDEGASALADWPGLASLRRLYLDGGSIGPHGATLLARSPWLERIEVLSLRRNSISRDYQDRDDRRAMASPADLLRKRFGRRVKLG
jgi:uncharacterized protein (TIGR02996 family)